MTEHYADMAECVAHGGHCFIRTGLMHPMSTPEYEEARKHCPAVRYASPREPWDYRYEEARP